MPAMSEKEFYSVDFFAAQVDGSARSAAVVAPLVLSLLPVNSVIDVGCGVGPWAAAFLANGVSDVWGVDGDYVERSQLRIPPDRFLAKDLSRTLDLGRTFDLAVCLEVAEHLPELRARGLIGDLTAMASCVLFSAAVPGPTGTNHINPQYLPYWIKLFAERGFQAMDPFRPLIWGNDNVEWFYQQDIVLFAGPGHPALELNFPEPLNLIHPELFRVALDVKPTLGMLAKGFPGALRRSIAGRLGLKGRSNSHSRRRANGRKE